MRGLFGSLTDAAASVAERMNVTDIAPLLLRNFGMRSKSGASVNVDTALGVTTVFAATRALAEGIAQIPLKLMVEDEKGNKASDRKHSVHRVLARKPNQWMTPFAFRETMMYHAVLTGNAFAFKVMIGPAKSRQLRELIPIPPGNVKICRQPDYSLKYEVHDNQGALIGTFGRDAIFHLTGPSWNTYSGLEVIRLARDAIGLAIATEENHSYLHANGSQVGGILSTESKLEPADLLRIKALWADGHEGGQNKFRTAVLDAGLTYTKMGMSGVDSQHVETREHQIKEICRAIGVFPMIIGESDKTATFASAEAFFSAHVVLHLSPWVQRWQDTVDAQLLSDDELDKGYFCKLFTAGLLRGDARARSAFYQVMVLTGVMTRNECRNLEDLNDLDGLDEPLVPLNMGIAGEVPADPNVDGSNPTKMPNVAIAPRSVVDAARAYWMGHNGGPGPNDPAEPPEPRVSSRCKNKGRVLSTANETLIREATDLIGQADGKLTDVLAKIEAAPEVTEDKA